MKIFDDRESAKTLTDIKLGDVLDLGYGAIAIIIQNDLADWSLLRLDTNVTESIAEDKKDFLATLKETYPTAYKVKATLHIEGD